jgi:hypothetical protein
MVITLPFWGGFILFIIVFLICWFVGLLVNRIYYRQLMNNYRCQNGCNNCKYVHVHTDYDIPPEYYCTLNCSLPKGFKNPFKKEFRESEKWCGERCVDPWGICDSFKKEEVNS